MRFFRCLAVAAALALPSLLLSNSASAGASVSVIGSPLMNAVETAEEGLVIEAQRKFRRAKRFRPGFHRRKRWRRKLRRKIRRRFWGRVVGGVVLGAVVTAAVAGRPPRRPSPDLCWNWRDGERRAGYWYYCSER